MIFSVPELIADISRYFTLKIGDVIFTGTPEGVGPVQVGDHLEGFLNGEKLLDVRVK
jgi:fumarylpyruvate hydrolase